MLETLEQINNVDYPMGLEQIEELSDMIISMSFQPVPSLSKKSINKAGSILISPLKVEASEKKARDILNSWRVAHAYPINTFQSTLKRKLANNRYGSDFIVAQRLKRSSTIIEKLRDLKMMQLTTMQDIAGVRAILSSMEDVRALEKEYTKNIKFAHVLKTPIKDYINFPKEHDGYRSLHLVYQYKNKNEPQYDGLWVELQIRTKLQHSWAMAVETMQRFMQKAIKTREESKGDRAWKSFFLIVSSAFALLENTPVVPTHKHMSRKDIFDAVVKAERGLKVIEKMKAFPVAIKVISEKANKSYYHLITLDTKQNKVFIKSFGRDEIGKAYQEYIIQEKRAINEPFIDPVLVSATKGSLEKAYPSFFDESNDFIVNLQKVIKESTSKVL